MRSKTNQARWCEWFGLWGFDGGRAVAVRCDGCIAFHVKAVIRAGVSREELLETIAMAIYMGGGPSMVYGAEALEAFDQFSSAEGRQEAR